MSVYLRPCSKTECKDKKCRHKHFHYRFRIKGIRYRGAIPEARTVWEAEQAEVKLKTDVYEGRYGSSQGGHNQVRSGRCSIQSDQRTTIGDFIETVFLPWAKTNFRSWENYHYMAPVIRRRFGKLRFDELDTQMVDAFKAELRNSITKRGMRRSEADTNHYLEMLSRVFTLAMEYGKAHHNPCKGRLFKLDNQRYRYLLPEEEPKLLEVLTGRRAHLRPQVIISIGTGLRKRELLDLQREHVDLSRNLIVVTRTKSRRNREVPMNDQVQGVIVELCNGKRPWDYLFANPRTGKPFTDVKHGFTSACRDAGIKGLWWHDLRATFGTRLGEAGFSLKYIMELMGHSDPNTCLRYVRATDAVKRAAVQAAMLGGHNGSPAGHKMDTWRLRAV
jgi:integrase